MDIYQLFSVAVAQGIMKATNCYCFETLCNSTKSQIELIFVDKVYKYFRMECREKNIYTLCHLFNLQAYEINALRLHSIHIQNMIVQAFKVEKGFSVKGEP